MGVAFGPRLIFLCLAQGAVDTARMWTLQEIYKTVFCQLECVRKSYSG